MRHGKKLKKQSKTNLTKEQKFILLFCHFVLFLLNFEDCNKKYTLTTEFDFGVYLDPDCRNLRTEVVL